MPKYTATTPIKHDGKRLAVGGSISLSEKEAQRLLTAGAIELAASGKTAEEIAAEKAAADKVAAEKAAAEKAAADKAEADAAKLKP